MAKKSSGRKRGIQRGVGKHKIKSQTLSGKEIYEQYLFGVPHSKYNGFSRMAFNLMFKGCELFHLIPFTRNESGEYVPLCQKEKIPYYVVMATWFAVSATRGWFLVENLVEYDLGIDGFLCLCLFLILFVSFSISSVMLFKPKETMDMLNAWPKVLASLVELREDIPKPFDDLSTSFKVITVFLATQGIALVGAIATLVFGRIPVCWFPLLERTGWIPDNLLPRFVWNLIFLPLEYATNLPPMLVAPFSGAIILVTVGVLKIYANNVRLAEVRDFGSREKIEMLYIRLELFNRVFQEWMRYFIPPTFIGMSTAIIVATFMAIRYTDLPLLIYVIFPYVGFVLMFIIFWMSYDVMRIVRDSEDILWKLLSVEYGFIRRLSRAERINVAKRARAMKPLEFPMGNFAEFSLNVPINIWDECLNQVLFLLSL